MNDTTFHGDGKVAYVPVVVDAKPKPITNAMKIRAMTDEELALYLDNMQGLAYINGFDSEPIRFYPNNYSTWLDWLRQEADNAKSEPAP